MDAISALEKKLRNTQEALQEVSKSREEADAALRDLLRRQTEALAALDEAKEVWASPEDPRSALDAGKRSREATPERQRTRREEVGRLLDEVPRLTAALKASQQQVS